MRKWTWLVLVGSGALAWACGGDDSSDDDDDGKTTTTGTSNGGSGGTSPTTTNGGGSGGSGGTDATTSVGGSGGSSTTGSGGTSSSGGSAGGAGEGAGGAAGAGGAPPDLTILEACEASCAAQDTSECGGDPYCMVFCEYLALDAMECEAEAIAQQACWGELEGDAFECDTGYPYPAPPNCEDENAAYDACVAG